ncbi:TPA: sigma 54-interacting transcriptional regulator [Clostridioides difficile]|nr:sigma 54-interacting transcriptional regulator [Clostridioides difficile]HDX7187756.1 sigma 54-interacting transcriptional regulator [Clostridioides difficile]
MKYGGIIMKEILVIAPTKGTYEKSIHIVKKNKYTNIDVVFGNLKEGIPLAEKSINHGTRIIISRGGTYNMLKATYNIPIVEIKVDAYDIIKSYKEVKNSNEPFGIIGFNNVIYGFDIIEEILNKKITMIEIEKEEEIYDAIEKYRKKGINTYIGDTTVAHIVKRLNCKGILIESREENILRAIQQAEQILEATKDEQKRRLQIEAMTDFVHDGIITVDKNFKITLFNKSAEKIFGIKKENALYHNVVDVIPNTVLPQVVETMEPQIGEIQNIGSTKIITNRVPIIVDGQIQGAVSTFQDSKEISSFEHTIRRSLLSKGLSAKYTFDDIIHASEKTKDCIELAKKYACYDTPMIITGESGVGKELFCQSIHNYSKRKNAPFVAVNCAAIPPSLIESEFFGYEEGSFTGARKKGKAGVFELAHEGTIFLDEISEIPLELQGRLLRVLQEKQVMRIGGDKVIPIDVKIICASNKDLKNMMRNGLFRQDLYFRINILTLYLPSLKERKEDIIKLSEFFIHKYSSKYNKTPLIITPNIKKALLEREYEGNIRELEGMMERAVIVELFDSILLEKLSNEYTNNIVDKDNSDFECSNLDLKTLEKKYIYKIYNENNRNTTKTCEILKITRSTLWRKLKEIEDDV